MHTHDQLVKKLMRRPGVRAEVECIEREESVLLDALLKARQEAGLTQGQVAARMRTHAPLSLVWSGRLPAGSTPHQSRRCVSTSRLAVSAWCSASHENR